jgi:hypothetical protein
MNDEVEEFRRELKAATAELEKTTVAKQQPINTLPCQQSRGPFLANGR